MWDGELNGTKVPAKKLIIHVHKRNDHYKLESRQYLVVCAIFRTTDSAISVHVRT